MSFHFVTELAPAHGSAACLDESLLRNFTGTGNDSLSASAVFARGQLDYEVILKAWQ